MLGSVVSREQPAASKVLLKYKCLLKEDKHTVRIIEYNSTSIDRASCSSVVTLKSSPEFGHIKSFFPIYMQTICSCSGVAN